jgi:hypothetical protein
MALLSSIFFLSIVTIVSSKSLHVKDPIFGQPEQIHISYGRMLKKLLNQTSLDDVFIFLEDPSLMVVTWVTMNDINETVVEYGQNGILDKRATGWVSVFQDSGSETRQEYIHRVVLQDLKPGQQYCMI